MQGNDDDDDDDDNNNNNNNNNNYAFLAPRKTSRYTDFTCY
jgi:hypothetical protein